MTNKLEEWRSPDNRKEVTKLSNRFSNLEEEEVPKEVCGIFMIGRRSIFQVARPGKPHQRIKQREGKETSTKNKKINKQKDHHVVSENQVEDMLNKFKTANRFDILRDNQEEDLLKILRTTKRSLKKCRKCNFKKRTCILDPSSCKEARSICRKCERFGHFPQSVYCKAQKPRKQKHSLANTFHNCPHSQKYKEDILHLLNKRIDQLEIILQEELAENRRDEIEDKTVIHIIPLDLIPFFMMYIFLNRDCMPRINDENVKGKLKIKQAGAELCQAQFKLG